MLTLATKEIRDSLLTLRFLAGTALAVLLVAVSVWALADDYGRRVAGHSRALALNEAHMAEYGHLNRTGSSELVGVAPRPMSTWVRGLSQGTHLDQFDNDPLPVLFPLVDVVAIVTVVFSLLALVFTFDLVSGERRAGTLRLLSSYGLSRPALVGGKLLGAAGTIAVPYAASWLVAALVAALASPVPWTGAEWGAAGAIGAGGLLYVLDFAALGLAVSTLTYRPRTSAFTVLAAWVALVLVVPNLAPFVASELRPLPSLTTLQRQISRMLDAERDALLVTLRDQAYERLAAEDPAVARYLGLAPSERAAAVAAEATPDGPLAQAARKLEDAWQEAMREGNRIQQEKADALQADFDRRADAQVHLARGLSLASPAPAFTYFATDLAETGLRYRERLEAQHEEFADGFNRWTRATVDRVRRQHPEIRDVWNTPTDLSDMPRFAYRSEPLADRLVAVLPWTLALAAYGLLFITVAVAGFVRYDVR